MSRGRLGAQLFTTVDHDDALTHHHQRPRLDDRDPHDSLVGALSRRSVKRFATNDRPLLVEASELAAGRTLAAIHERLGYVEAVIRDLALAGRVDPVDLQDRLERATLTRCRIRPGSRVRAADRDNVGTIALIADSAGAAWTRFRSETGHISHRWIPWEELTPLDDAESAPTELPAAARRHLRVLELEVRAEHERWSRLLATHGVRSDERDLLMAAIHQRTERLAHRLAAQPPAWLDEIIGPAPDDAIGRAVWGDELRRIAAWRDLHRVGPEQPGYGPSPLEPALHHAWLAQHGRTRRIHAWLTEQYGDRPEPSGRLRTLESIRRRLRSEQILGRDAGTDLAVISDDPSSRDRPIPPPSTQDLARQAAVPAAGQRPIGRRSTGITIA